MSVIQVGLVDTTGKLDPELVQSAAAALNLQVIRDLPQYWSVSATVIHLPNPKRIPAGVWPVRLVAKLPPGEGGVHLDKNNQPYSLVIADPGSDEWTIDASHETLEMLVDPNGNKLQNSTAIAISGNSVVDASGEFSYLVEVADPVEADNYSYAINGIAVSDFITPHYYDPQVSPGTHYSFTGALKAPRQLLPGGYISFINLETEEWQQILWVDPSKPPQLNNLGPATGQSLRVWVDAQVTQYKEKYKIKRPANQDLLAGLKKHRAKLSKIAQLRAGNYGKY